MPKKYAVSITIVEIDDEHEPVEDGFESDMECVVATDGPPVSEVMKALNKVATDFCT
jgi:hypothetical protein